MFYFISQVFGMPEVINPDVFYYEISVTTDNMGVFAK